MSNGKESTAAGIRMDVGTAYDFFASLFVLHMPKKFAVRGAWASGMLARLSPESRETLSITQQIMTCPVHLLPSLPEPKNVETLLWTLAQMHPRERLQRLTCSWDREQRGCLSVFSEVAERGQWTAADRQRLVDSLHSSKEAEKTPPEDEIDALLDVWANAEGFGEAYLAALRSYHEVFFHEEERRIRPAIEAAAERVSQQAKELLLSDLIEEVSGGIRFEGLPGITELVLAPSYWITPLMLRIRLDEKRMLFVFGARAATDSIVPGETVPDGLIRALKALSDPTRLRILRLVADRSMGAAEMARRLRLRTPTVLHHLHALRLSGLIQIRMPEAHTKEKACFSLRSQEVREVMKSLDKFLHRPGPGDGKE